jgi:uncharacterized protein YndB with AHSA1/START domain
MMEEIEPIRRSVTVQASPERAFEVFTEGFGSWWPLEVHSLAMDEPLPGEEPQVPATAIIEPREGGRVFEQLADGRENGWGTVTAWDPPRRLVIAWSPVREPRPTTDIEVSFIARGDGTLVELTHTGWERLGPRGVDARAGYDSGWPGTLARFAEAANG